MDKSLAKANSVFAVISAIGSVLAVVGVFAMSIIGFIRGANFVNEVEKAYCEQ